MPHYLLVVVSLVMALLGSAIIAPAKPEIANAHEHFTHNELTEVSYAGYQSK